ncbi:Malonyl CoA-acyl carrier protein transacylase [Alphaproteobacteria bacterium]
MVSKFDQGKVALVFPGQGSQVVGMGRELYDAFHAAREVFTEVDEALQQNLSKMMFHGDIDELTLTVNAQPAIMAVSVAVLRVILGQSGCSCIDSMCSIVAGHSLGEYTALCAANAISLHNTAKLLRIRGKAMHDTLPTGKGGMLALLGTDIMIAEKVVNDAKVFGKCDIANDNGAGQVVLSGEVEAINRAEEVAVQYGSKKAIRLSVSSAFHSELMLPAQPVLERALSEIDMQKPIVPIVSNYTAQATQDIGVIKLLLVHQISGRVRWRESVLSMHQEHEVDTFVEIGPGKVLSGLAKKIIPTSITFNVGVISEMEAFLEFLSN